MATQMRLGLGQFSEVTDDLMTFIRQLGVEDIVLNSARLPGDERWEFMDLLDLRTTVENAGLRIGSLENVPHQFYDKVMLGLPGREEQIENMAATIRNIGRAGISILGYHWMPNRVWRSSRTTPGRGGVKVTRFDLELVKDAPLSHDREYTEDELWDNYEYFMKRIIPVAEDAGVKLALHPDDPPVASLGGVGRCMRSFDGFKRAMEIGDSPMNGLNFCHGCWSEMKGGEGVLDAVRYFGGMGKIFYVHFRDVKGTAECFDECFIDEGNNNMLEVVKTLKEVGFDSFMIPDHVPKVVDDSSWNHRGRAYAIGYMRALLEVVNSLP